MGKMFFNILATFAEFEVDPFTDAHPRGNGCRPLSPKQQVELRRMHASGDYSITDLADLFSVSRPTVYRTLQTKQTPAAKAPVS